MAHHDRRMQGPGTDTRPSPLPRDTDVVGSSKHRSSDPLPRPNKATSEPECPERVSNDRFNHKVVDRYGRDHDSAVAAMQDALSRCELEKAEMPRSDPWLSRALEHELAEHPSRRSHEVAKPASPVAEGPKMKVRFADTVEYVLIPGRSPQQEPASLHRPISPPPLRRLPARYKGRLQQPPDPCEAHHRRQSSTETLPERTDLTHNPCNTQPHTISILKVLCRCCGGETNYSTCSHYIPGVNDCQGNSKPWRRRWCAGCAHTDESGWALEKCVVEVKVDRNGELEKCELCEWWDHVRGNAGAEERKKEMVLRSGHLWL